VNGKGVETNLPRKLALFKQQGSFLHKWNLIYLYYNKTRPSKIKILASIGKSLSATNLREKLKRKAYMFLSYLRVSRMDHAT
jgi:hypothetical protein